MSEANRQPWRGLHAVMVTPFDKRLEVDWNGLKANVEFLVEAPVDVIVCLGSEGEFYALTDRERHEVTVKVVDAVGGRKPVVVGVSTRPRWWRPHLRGMPGSRGRTRSWRHLRTSPRPTMWA